MEFYKNQDFFNIFVITFDQLNQKVISVRLQIISLKCDIELYGSSIFLSGDKFGLYHMIKKNNFS